MGFKALNATISFGECGCSHFYIPMFLQLTTSQTGTCNSHAKCNLLNRLVYREQRNACKFGNVLDQYYRRVVYSIFLSSLLALRDRIATRLVTKMNSGILGTPISDGIFKPANREIGVPRTAAHVRTSCQSHSILVTRVSGVYMAL